MIEILDKIWIIITFGTYDLNAIESMSTSYFLAIIIVFGMIWTLITNIILLGVARYVGINL